MSPETVQKILAKFDKGWNNLARLLGMSGLAYNEGAKLVPKDIFGQNMLALCCRYHVESILIPDRPDLLGKRDFTLVDTREKFESFLLAEPDPTPKELGQMLSRIDKVLPGL